MKRRNRKTSKMPNAFVTKLIIGLVVVFLVFVAWQKIIRLAKEMDYFTIQKVDFDPSLKFIASRELRELEGKSIFSVNLQKIQNQVQARYPDIAKLRITRRFPNTIYVTAKERLPFVRVKINGKTVIIDKELVVLSDPKASSFVLPIIEGLSLDQDSLNVGRRIKDSRLRVAVFIIETFRDESNLSNYRIERLDVGRLTEIEMFLTGGIMIVIGQENIPEKIKQCGLILSQGQKDLSVMNKIDVRFTKPLGKK
ncbi:MAG: FtsQ-type POTRA domain-containing protein [Candidatus Omnitrophota bacterium]